MSIIKFNDPVNVNMPVEIGPYTFLDRDTELAIDMTSDFVATSVNCQLKRQRAVYATVAGTWDDQDGGIAHVASYTFTATGVWMYQFYATNASGEKLWGRPVQFR